MHTPESMLGTQLAADAGSKLSPKLLSWLVAGGPIVGLALAIPLVRSPLFMDYADMYGVTAQRSIYETSNKSCDVVLFGDSTTIVGLDPRAVSQGTRLLVCNIGITGASLQALGTAPLDEYLARNPRPKYLLMQFNVGDIALNHDPKEEKIEGIIPLFRYGKFPLAMRHICRNADLLIALMHYTYVDGAKNLFSRFIKKTYPIQTKELGAYTVMPLPPLAACPAYDPRPVNAEQIAWLRHLRGEYADRADHVLLNAAPMSICNPYHDAWQRSLKNEVDNKELLYPLYYFVDIHFHMTREGALRYSKETAEEILGVSRSESTPR